MTTASEVLAMMKAYDMPPLPSGHPIFDGKYKRFGPKKKGWYVLRELTLKSGRTVVTGAFGFFQGDNRNTVPVTMDLEGMSEEECAEAIATQRAYEKAEAEKKEEEARLAANRATDQLSKARADANQHPYMLRKKITAEGVFASDGGLLLIPMRQYSLDGAKLVGLQKISEKGGKFYNEGMDKIGAGLLLGAAAAPKVIAVGEGYATCRTVRMVPDLPVDLPVMVAFDAGSILQIARNLRRDFPHAHLLFLTDDDFLIEERFVERLLEDFEISEHVPVDGVSHRVVSTKGEAVDVLATWKSDANDVPYIEADVRAGRRLKTYKFENAGVSKSRAAAKEVGNSSIVLPLFSDRGRNKWTDFNDLYVEESMSVVAAQIGAAVSAALFAAAVTELSEAPPWDEDPALQRDPPRPPEGIEASGGTPPEQQKHEKPPALASGADASTDSPEVVSDAAGGGGGGKKPKGKVVRTQEFWDSLEFMMKHFVLLYGTNTAWDSANRMQILIPNLRYAYGTDVLKFWLGNPGRKMVNSKNLVFDPTESVDEETHVNMFAGFKVKPKAGSCQKILDLLSHLCGGDQTLIDWILRWTAYPLQNPGAKMASSIIMHGDEGSGKNLFWEHVVRKVYGEYAGVIGNAQIEAPFNEWASQKLFLVCDEVVTRNELRQLKGKLKGLISGEEIRINPKNFPERSEANHLNIVFLSNELQPLALDKTDRRYLVIWTPPKQSQEYYEAVANEADSGGVEAFYHYLLHDVDCSDFSPHTKPLDTKAKQNLISLGLSAPERFYREWEAGGLPLAFINCTAMQLYAAFLRWSHLNGERFPPSQTLFGRTVDRMAAGKMRRKTVKFGVGHACKQKTVYLVTDPPEGKTLADWVTEGSDVFEKDLRAYRHVYDQPQTTGE